MQRASDASYSTKIDVWLNMGQEYAANKYDFWAELQAPPYDFKSVNATETYYMPSDWDKPFRIYDLTNNKQLNMISREEYYDANVKNISAKNTGTPSQAMLYGISPIKFIIGTSSFTIQAKSSSTSDTTNAVVRIEGWLDSAKTILGYTTVTISSSTPTTYIADPNAIAFFGITRITKSIDTTGFITVADNNSNILATISPLDRQSRYPVLYLGLIPNAVISYEALYKRKVKKMVDSNDYPFADIGDFLTQYAVAFAYNEEKETQPRAQMVMTQAEALLTQAIRNEQDKYGTAFQHKYTFKTNQAHRF